MMNRLLAGAMHAVDMMRPFSGSFASSSVESAYAGERPVHDAPQLSCDGRLLVLPRSSPLKGSLQYDEKIVCCVLTIAQFRKYYVADHRARIPARRFSGKMGT
jgi:phage gpG-like protein